MKRVNFIKAKYYSNAFQKLLESKIERDRQ